MMLTSRAAKGINHFAPHPRSKFEGYYSKFTLPSGASLALVVCSVPQAKTRPHMVSFTYVPHDTSKIFQKELWVDNIARVSKENDAFELQVDGIGSVDVSSDSTTKYSLKHDCFAFEGITRNQVPWSGTKSTPEGLLVNLPLPLHWHVQSLSSKCDFSMKLVEYDFLPTADAKGTATVHQEKNWGQSFPSAHIWIQARREKYNLCIAGGHILGMKAFLAAFRSPMQEIDFRPPLALSILGVSPFMRSKVDWNDRKVEFSVTGWTKKLAVTIKAPKGTFFGLSAPFYDGHRKNFLSQSFQARAVVRVWERRWWQLFGGWSLTETVDFEGASLEFGGDFYPDRGTDQRTH